MNTVVILMVLVSGQLVSAKAYTHIRPDASPPGQHMTCRQAANAMVNVTLPELPAAPARVYYYCEGET